MLTSSYIFFELISSTLVSDLYLLMQHILCLFFSGPYGNITVPLVNPMSNAVMERVYQVLGNLVRTFNVSTQAYVEKYDPWMGILSASVF